MLIPEQQLLKLISRALPPSFIYIVLSMGKTPDERKFLDSEKKRVTLRTIGGINV